MLILLHIAASAGYLASRRWGGRVFAAAAMLHAATVLLHYQQQPRFDVALAFSLFMLTTMAIGGFVLSGGLSRLLLVAMGAASAPAPLLFQADKPFAGDIWLHLVPAMLGYSLSLIALLQWAELRAAEAACRRLVSPDGAPLLQLEKKCFAILDWAFFFITLTVLSGGARLLFAGGDFALSHKNLFAALTWLTFLTLVAGRRIYGWRGAAAQWGICAGFLFLLLSYFGSHFVLQFALGRAS